VTRYITDIDASTPDGTDSISAGDDQIRTLKQDIKNTFPKLAGEVSASHTEVNRLVGLSGSIVTTTDVNRKTQLKAFFYGVS